MRAAVLDVPGGLTVEDVEPLAPGPRDAVVRIEASGVCHSDLHVIHGAVEGFPPTILGHEGAGIVEAVGSEVTSLAVGDRVIGAFIPACGTCWWCLHDESHLCVGVGQNLKPRVKIPRGAEAIALTGLGTFADMMTCHEASLVKVETDLPAEQLALLGCAVTTGVGAVFNAAKVQPGASVAVIGCGGVGQAVIQGANIAGAARIIAIDPIASKRDTALKLGATHAIDPGDGDPVEQVQALTGGRGVDYSFEVIGLPQTIQQAFASARRGGTAVIVGISEVNDPLPIGLRDAFMGVKNLIWTLYGSMQVKRDFNRLIDLVEAGRLDLSGMVSRTITLDEVNDAFRAMEAGEVIRSVIV
jgi:S-(hydroxymethyl)glutathione dehydrogenase/alcohol dehydrogenase